MSRTRRELIDKVVANLGVLVPGQSPGDEVISKVDAGVDPTVARDNAIGLPFIADAGTPNPPSGGEIDDAVFIALSHRVTWTVAGEFNSADSPSLKVLNDLAEQELRIIGRPASTRRTLRGDLQLTNRRGGVIGNFTRGT
jgi:hypothetical protein